MQFICKFFKHYGNKQNRFWKMLSQIFEEEISDEIQNKKQFLFKHNIALYDVVAESNLSGSADIALEKSEHKAADIGFLLPPNTKVKKILCNGKTAYNLLFLQNLENVFQAEEVEINSQAKQKCNKQEAKSTKNLKKAPENQFILQFASCKITVICLPSTSPANPRFTLSAWQQHISFFK